MPSKKDPNNLRVGTGLAGRGSVAITSITFSGATGSGDDVSASEVSNETPLPLSGDNVQEHINQAALQAPVIPNVIGSTSNPINSGEVDTNPTSVSGFYFNGGATAAALFNGSPVTVQGVVFPADRGILVLEVDGNAEAALDLGAIFVEGDVEDVTAPSRGVGQNDYTAGTNPNATVDGLPQGFDLTYRLPVSSNFGGGVPYDDYTSDFAAQQLATFSVDYNQTADTAATYRVVHYRSLRDYETSGETFGDSDVPTGGGVDVFSDGTAAAPVPTTFTMTPAAPSSAGSKVMSGVSVYDPSVDSFDVSYTVSNIFDNSFLASGIALRQQPGRDEDRYDAPYTDYDSGNPAPGQVASYAGPSPFASFKVVELDPQLYAQNAFGTTATFASTTPETILINGLTFETAGSVSATRLTTETFKDEATRYPFPGNMLMEPDGTGSAFNPGASLGSGDAQVRPVPVGTDLSLIEGGELGYPSTDYSTSYFPTGNPDYSGFSTTAHYYRAFDMGSPVREGRFRFVGKPDSVNLFEDFRWDPTVNNSANNFGHPEGVKIELRTNVNDDWRDLGRPYAQGGALTSFEIESANSVIVSFLLENLPELSPAGYYPVQMAIIMYGAVAPTATFYKIELLPAL